jgi:hypothetical protein
VAAANNAPAPSATADMHSNRVVMNDHNDYERSNVVVAGRNAADPSQPSMQPAATIAIPDALDIPSDTAPSTSGIALPATHPSEQSPMPMPPGTKPCTESMQYLRYLGSMALKPLREMQLADKLQNINENVEIEEVQRETETDQLKHQHEMEEFDRASVQLARELQDKEEEEECQRMKLEADTACQLVSARYDALVKFTTSCPRGNYEEFIEFLLMGGGRSEHDNFDDDPTEYYNNLLFENFYDEMSVYKKLWNDNLTLGLPQDASTLEGRAFVPARESTRSSQSSTEGSSLRLRTFSEDERLRNIGLSIQNQIAQLDKQRIKQGLGSAVGLISNVSSFALKPLRDLQLAEKLNAINIDMEEEEARKEIEQYNRRQEEMRDLEEMMRFKREAEESCLNTTTEHLLGFIQAHPTATYQQWIEDLHPENAHDGALLEGLGKTIDHRFFVEESDHRRIWNENLFTSLDRDCSVGRQFVPARTSMTDENGDMIIAVDILSGSSGHNGTEENVTPQQSNAAKSEDTSVDLIEFD